MIKFRVAILLNVFVFSICSAQTDDLFSYAYADTLATMDLDEVIISATRNTRQLSSVPHNAQVITKKELESINSIRLSDILNEQTGLITIPDFGGGEGVQIQGFDSQYILIMIDGVPLIGRSAGTLDLNRISVGNIKQIEIVKGASSSLYGNEALGGIINIITETPANGFHGSINYRGGSFNSHDLSGNLDFKKDRLATSFFINRNSSNGFDLIDSTEASTVEPFVNYTFNPKVSYRFSKSTNITVSGRYYYQQQDNVASEELTGESTINEWNTHVNLNHIYNDKWDSYIEFYATQYRAGEFLNNQDGSRFSESDFNQYFIRPEVRTTYTANRNNVFIAGVGVTNETLIRADFFQTPEFIAPYVYLQYDGQILDRMNVVLGARFDSHNVYASQLSPKAAVRYEINDKLAIKVSVGYGYKAPDFRQLYFDFSNSTVGYTVLGYNAVSTRIPQMEAEGELVNIGVPLSEFNQRLDAESSVNINAGIDYRPFENVELSANYFRNSINNLIDIRVIARKTNGQNVFSYYNINEVLNEGLEINAKWVIIDNLTISGGYQLLYARDMEAVNAFDEGNVFARFNSGPSIRLSNDDYFGLLNRSRHMGNMKLFYEVPALGLDANIRGTYRSKYGLFDSNNNTYLDNYDQFVDGFMIWDFAVNKTYKKITGGFGIDNLFGFTDPGNISNIPGRIIYGKLNFTF